MTVTDLIIALTALPGDLEVVIDRTVEDDEMFALEVLSAIDEILTENGEKFVVLNITGNTITEE